MYKKIITIALLVALVVQLKAQTAPSFTDIRQLSEINSGLPQSYPYISCDGQRFYYIEGSLNTAVPSPYQATVLKMANWNSSANSFCSTASGCSTITVPTPGCTTCAVGGIPAGITSYWLSSGEKEIFYVKNQLLYTATRANNACSTAFGAATPITLQNSNNVSGYPNLSLGYIAAPSVTPCTSSLTERSLYLYFSTFPTSTSPSQKSILKFTQSCSASCSVPSCSTNTTTTSTNYNYAGTLTIPSGYTAGSGQLSCDNPASRYYLSLSAPDPNYPNNTLSTIYYINLTNMAFVQLVNEVSNSSIQPTASLPGITTQTLVTVVNPTVANPAFSSNGTLGSWDNNDLYIANFTPTTGNPDSRLGLSDPVKELYLSDPIPNPSSGEVTINYSLPDDCNNSILTLYSIEGFPIKSITLDSQKSSILLNNSAMNSGLYLYSLNTNQGTLTKRMLVIK